MPRLFYACLLFLICSYSFAQNGFTIKGKIIDATSKQPIESATVYISKAKDSSVVDYTISNKSGNFILKIKKMTQPFYLKISNIGFQDFKKDFQVLDSDKNFETIELFPSVKNLNEVVIKNEAPPIRIKKDTLEFNASSFKVRPDANVETLLKQLPGVEIDSDGKITVNGKEVNQILVNGKPFFDKDGKVALQNLPSDIIKKVQITDTKTKQEEKTKQVASSDNASINLTIDEKKNKGFFGKILGGLGTNKRYESSALVNYFNNKRKISLLASSNNINSTGFSMDEIFDNMGGGRNSRFYSYSDGTFGVNGKRFGSGSGITVSNMVGMNYSDEWNKYLETTGSYFYSNTNTKNENKFNQTNFLPTGNFTTNSTSSTNEIRDGHNLDFQFEIKIDSTASLIFEPKLAVAKNRSGAVSHQVSKDQNSFLLNESTSDNSTDSDANNFENLLTFTKNFKKKGRYLSSTFRNVNNKSDENNFTNSSTTFYQGSTPNDIRNQISKTHNVVDNYDTEIEYSEPIADSLKLKISAQINLDKYSNDKKAFDFNSVSNDYTIQNNFLSNFQSSSSKTIVPKAGFSIEKKMFNFNFSAGTSIYQFNNFSNYIGNQLQLNRNYIVPDVSVSTNIKFTKSKSIWLSYNYESDLPSASQILPVENLSNPLYTYIGNANLDLTRNHNFYLSFRNYDNATRSGYGVYTGGNLFDNQIVTSSMYDNSGKKTSTYENVSGTSNFWSGIYFNKSIKKEKNNIRYSFNNYYNYGNNKGFINGSQYDAKSLSMNVRLGFTYEFSELFTINPTYVYTYNVTHYTNYSITSANNFTHKFNLQTTNYWPKNWVFGNDFGYNYNSNIASGYKKDFYLWNTSLSYSFYQKKITAKVKVYDLLNQNQNATRTITPTTIRDEENIVLKRYVMFSLSYKLGQFGKEKKPTNRFMW